MPTERGTRGGRINLLADPVRLLRQRDAARSALAKILHLTYDEDMPERLERAIKAEVMRGTRQ